MMMKFSVDLWMSDLHPEVRSPRASTCQKSVGSTVLQIRTPCGGRMYGWVAGVVKFSESKNKLPSGAGHQPLKFSCVG